MLTQKDQGWIEKAVTKVVTSILFTIVNQRFDGLEKQFYVLGKQFDVLKNQVDSLGEKIDLLPTKDEHFRKMDEVVTELQKSRDEHVVMRGQLGNHEERIEMVETHLKISPKN
ncbi:hypothetical protein A3A55_01165 [Candidatus Roizmanbacteria bacterium RIFCSPLOWO2_01_FULL_40_14]|uniref:Uncharacterized protein n=1 Tax=Candidatus Roizmanbacteria bacterium GW2011_GWB1_40_7 TaxID=1618482 RepID=A0A0G0WAV9_9BACT|nr:MAG: hypothetical protein UU14_C0006G0016 [Candidatus Roizmanbacteria bacterium GW2011_GWB1_40_7]OGK50075.1 MAG: hypothetical protein A3A55_01165 [Candidatus Roizmanbacteria bacterium RIFCSPLOWO2_01_FULL_40_14]